MSGDVFDDGALTAAQQLLRRRFFFNTNGFSTMFSENRGV